MKTHSLPTGIYAPLLALNFAKQEMELSVITACKSLGSAVQYPWEELPGGSRVQSRVYGVCEGSFMTEGSKIMMAADDDLLVTFELNPDPNTDTDRTVEDPHSMTPYELYTSGKVIPTSIYGK